MAPLYKTFFFSREGEIEFNTAIIKQPSEDYFPICLRDDIYSYTIQRMSMDYFLLGCMPLEIHLPRISRFAKAGILHPEGPGLQNPCKSRGLRGVYFPKSSQLETVYWHFFPEGEVSEITPQGLGRVDSVKFDTRSLWKKEWCWWTENEICMYISIDDASYDI